MSRDTAAACLFLLTLAFLAMGSLPAAAFTCLAMVAVGLTPDDEHADAWRRNHR